MGFEPWFIVAIACNFAGYATYLIGMRRDLVQPNRASWLIWSAATAIEGLTYLAINPGALQGTVFLVSAVLCFAVTAILWRKSTWAPPTAQETFCIAACLMSLVLWLGFQNAVWAHFLVVAAVPISFWPTWVSVWKDRTRERSPAWGLWTVGDLATLFVALRGPSLGVDELGYILVELVCHASVWFMIGLATINPLRSLGLRRGGLLVLDNYRPASNLFRVEDNHLGKGVYAARRFLEGDELMEFTGRRFSASEVPTLMRGPADRFVQVTPDHFMGPSGRIDDLVNHSCEPNAGLRFTEDGVFLVAIRTIPPGEEITWDYSTTLAESNWHMICQCRAENCRRVIGNFDSIEPDRQEWFRARNLVAPYLRRRDPVSPPDRRNSAVGRVKSS